MRCTECGKNECECNKSTEAGDIDNLIRSYLQIYGTRVTDSVVSLYKEHLYKFGCKAIKRAISDWDREGNKRYGKKFISPSELYYRCQNLSTDRRSNVILANKLYRESEDRYIEENKDQLDEIKKFYEECKEAGLSSPEIFRIKAKMSGIMLKELPYDKTSKLS